MEKFCKSNYKAQAACETSKNEVSHHFVEVNKMITLGKGGQREVEDICLSRLPEKSIKQLETGYLI